MNKFDDSTYFYKSYYSPCAALWYQRWRLDIDKAQHAQSIPELMEYCRISMIHHMEYLCATAMHQ